MCPLQKYHPHPKPVGLGMLFLMTQKREKKKKEKFNYKIFIFLLLNDFFRKKRILFILTIIIICKIILTNFLKFRWFHEKVPILTSKNTPLILMHSKSYGNTQLDQNFLYAENISWSYIIINWRSHFCASSREKYFDQNQRLKQYYFWRSPGLC